MRKHPRIRVFNHRAGDAPVMGEEASANLPFARKQALDDALSNLKRAVGIIPSSVSTTHQVEATKRALGHANQELRIAMKILLEKQS